jgi:hypothetical protein
MADTVEKISRKDRRLYHKVESAILFPAAAVTTDSIVDMKQS